MGIATISGISYGCISLIACSRLSYNSLRVLKLHTHSWACSIFPFHQYVLVIGPDTQQQAARCFPTTASAIFCAPSLESLEVCTSMKSVIVLPPFLVTAIFMAVLLFLLAMVAKPVLLTFLQRLK